MKWLDMSLTRLAIRHTLFPGVVAASFAFNIFTPKLGKEVETAVEHPNQGFSMWAMVKCFGVKGAGFCLSRIDSAT
ncbi:uncharacterized protein BDW70DRAFT_134064 [Aspergillus foveolatus]|uniref:uncharacterized protein n=1 Tax=Aspergillus foveolatus TaxID=210207 RepID=UPI003CCC92C9